MVEPPGPTPSDGAEGAAVEFEVPVPPSGDVTVVSGKQHVSLHQAMAGRTVTVWADLRGVHLTCDGHLEPTTHGL